MKKYFYPIGLALILFACCDLIFIGLLMYGDYLIGIAGAVLVLLSNQKIWVKAVTILLLPLIVIYGSLLFIFLTSPN